MRLMPLSVATKAQLGPSQNLAKFSSVSTDGENQSGTFVADPGEAAFSIECCLAWKDRMSMVDYGIVNALGVIEQSGAGDIVIR